MTEAPAMKSVHRLVVKIGSALLVDEESGQIRQAWLDALAADVASLQECGHQVLLVSSGAIAVGRRHLGLIGRGLRLEEKQAAAATGQIRLAHAYEEALGRHGITVAQILLTLQDTEERRRHLNARATLCTLLELGVVPVVNENDTVTTAEIRFGDNDRLSARVAAMLSADALILLSDIDGLYTADPRKDPQARHIPTVHTVNSAMEAMAGSAPRGFSSGGMVTKLMAAKIALAAGCRMAIADGRLSHGLRRLVAGGQATWFLPSASPLTARKRWIAGSLNPMGTLWVDAGAVRALRAGRSLLPIGITRVEGTFQRGDAVTVRGPDDREIARGLSAYGRADADRIIGRRSQQISEILGFQGRDEMIHRDDLVLISEVDEEAC